MPSLEHRGSRLTHGPPAYQTVSTVFATHPTEPSSGRYLERFDAGNAARGRAGVLPTGSPAPVSPSDLCVSAGTEDQRNERDARLDGIRSAARSLSRRIGIHRTTRLLGTGLRN